ncbi:hypothetical protein [Burkholderia ubonensis]|uniref:hypothetical protein n=1 Tax=Burkholderia ubonensis TaxID=101571 RepID=UPI00075CCCAF|nr:hypothetical protein [Burkholderia ubonensis]KVT38556.1 hypothetical protein WK51_15985 [Burkholderia ubonensis]
MTTNGRSRAAALTDAFTARLTIKQPAPRAGALPDAPVRPEYDADAVRFGTCEHCGKRADIRPHDGAKICGACADADYLSAWIDYAERLCALLAASPVEQPAAAPADERAEYEAAFAIEFPRIAGEIGGVYDLARDNAWRIWKRARATAVPPALNANQRAAVEFALGACAGHRAGEPHVAALESLLAVRHCQPDAEGVNEDAAGAREARS